MKCDTDLLESLVLQSLPVGEEMEAVTSHLETCQRCQQTLADFGGDPNAWEDARVWLSGVDESPLIEGDCLPLPPIDLSFLQPPSHPEMLGRIGRYEVESVLGRGGMGVVFRAHDIDLHRTVAIKVLAPEWAASIPARQRFAREAQAAASVAHENVIPIYNVEADANLPFLVMRYVPGMTLQRWVKSNGPPDIATVLRVAGQLAEGLAAAHRRGLVHRDIKPGNVMVGENIQRIWITDFGLARAADSVTLTQTGIIAGTPHYMSPEQARGGTVDHQSDLFSLGCTLYFLSTGHPPFQSDNTLAILHRIATEDPVPLASLRDDLPPAFAKLVAQLLDRRPSNRPVDCDAVIEALKMSQSQLDEGKTARAPMKKRTRRVLIACGLAASFGLIVALSKALLPAEIVSRLSFTGSADVALQNAGVPPNGTSNQDSIQVSPYISQAASQIENAALLDSRQLNSRIDASNKLVDRLGRADSVFGIPGLKLDNQRWQRDVDRLEKLIRRTQQR